MDIRDSQRIKEIRDNTAKMADAFTRIADALERLADRKTENSSKEPNNFEDFFRELTAEERKAVHDYIDSISVTTGVNIFDFMGEPTISKMEQVDESQIQLTAKCLNCNNSKACKENHWEGCVYEPKDEKTCETCRHWKYIAHEWQCEACKCQGYEPKDEPQTERSE